MIVRTTAWSAGPGCHGGCGVLAHIEDGKLVKIEGGTHSGSSRTGGAAYRDAVLEFVRRSGAVTTADSAQ